MIDNLIQYLLEEIAMDGEEGTDVSRLNSFVIDFFAQPTSDSTKGFGASPTTQNIDQAYLSFVWRTLIDQEDVRVWALTALETNEGEGGEQQVASTSALPEAKGKGKVKASKEGEATHTLVPVEGEEKFAGRDALVEKYGDGLRIAVSSETAWVAITGSHDRPSTMTAKAYEVLQVVSRARGEGKTAATLAKELGIDPKSVFHFVRVGVEAGIVKKFRVTEGGSWTNKVLHIRYLSVSLPWAQHIAANGPEVDADTGGGGGEDDEDDIDASTYRSRYLTPLTFAQLYSDGPFVPNRILRAVKAAENQMLPYSSLSSSIVRSLLTFASDSLADEILVVSRLPQGLVSHTQKDLRRLGRLVRKLCELGRLEKVQHYFGDAPARCLRLVAPQLSADENSAPPSEEEEPEEIPHALAQVSLERQVLDLLVRADSNGLRQVDMASVLDGYSARTLDQCLTRLDRFNPPSHLADFAIRSVTENFGREKRTRWFLLSAYVRRLASEQIVEDIPNDLQNEAIGSWSDLDPSGFYTDSKHLTEICRVMNLDQSGGGGGTRLASIKQPSVSQEPEEGGSQMGTANRSEAEGGDSNSEASVPKAVKKRKAATKKTKTPKPPKERKPGPPTYYERCKAEAAERVRLGLPPKPKRDPSLGGRKTKAAKAALEEERRKASETPGGVEDGAASGSRPAPRVRAKRLAKPVVAIVDRGSGTDEDDIEVQDDRGSDTSVRPPPAESSAPSTAPKGKKVDQAPPSSTTVVESNLPPIPVDEPVLPPLPNATADNAPSSTDIAPPRKRGRPPKKSVEPTPAAPIASTSEPALPLLPSDTPDEVTPLLDTAPPPRKRGRPPKKSVDPTPGKKADQAAPPSTPAVESNPSVPVDEPVLPPLPSKTTDNTPSSSDAVPPPRKRGRPPKNSLASTPTAPIASTSALPHVGVPAVAEGAGSSNANIDPSLLTHKSASGATPIVPSDPSPAAPAPVAPPPRKRGRPPKAKTPAPPTPITVAIAEEENELEEAEKEVAPEAGSSEVRSATTKRKASTSRAGPKKRRVEEVEPEAGPMAVDEADGKASLSVEKEADQQEGPLAKPALKQGGERIVVDGPEEPATGSERGETAPARPRPRKSYPAPPRLNLSLLKRQTDVLAYLTELGGIIDISQKHGGNMTKWLRARNPDQTVFEMDRTSFSQAVKLLVSREICRQTFVQASSGQKRRHIVYLPHIALDSPEMTTFLSNVKAPKLRALPLVYRPESGGEEEEKDWVTTTAPEATDDPQTVHAYFMSDNQIASAQYGCHYGRFARAKELHKALVKVVTENNGSKFVLSRGPDAPAIVSTAVLWTSLSLGSYLKIVPVSVQSDQLAEYLANPDNLNLPLDSIPPWVTFLVQPSESMKRRAMYNSLRHLVQLNLVQPLKKTVSTNPAAPVTFEEVEPGRSEHIHEFWLVRSTAPVYAFNTPSHPLLAVSPVSSVEEAEQYWKQIRATTLPIQRRGSHSTAPQFVSDLFSSHFKESPTLPRQITSELKWCEHYYLRHSQRLFLTKFLESRDRALFDQTPEGRADLAQLARSILAPVHTVEQYLIDSRKRATQNKSKNPKRVKVGSSGEEEDEEVEDGGGRSSSAAPRRLRVRRHYPEKAGPPVNVEAALQQKAVNSAEQRERDWHAIVERFKSQHGISNLQPAAIVDWLKGRFCSSKPINAKTLDSELLLLLDADDTPSYQSIVPVSIRRALKDPFALPPSGPVARKKPKAKVAIRTVAPKAAPVVVVSSGTQNDFVTGPVREVPVLQPGQRFPRHFFTDEQNDLFLDAGAIIKARCRLVDQRVLWVPLEKLFVGVGVGKLRQNFVRLIGKKEVLVYHERLVEAWINVWNQKRGTDELPDPEPTSVTAYDIAAYVRCLRANVNKQALRLAGPSQQLQVTSFTPLPASIVKLEQEYAVRMSGGGGAIPNPISKFANYWKSTSASASREACAEGLPFSCSIPPPRPPIRRELSRTISAVKMILATPHDSYDSDQAHAFLLPVQQELEPALEVMLDAAVIQTKHSEMSRRDPGRNFAFTERFLALFDDVTSPLKLQAAVLCESALSKKKSENVWPLITTDGEMMAFVNMVSNGTVDVQSDPSATAELRDPEDYATRKADDETIECRVHISYLASATYVQEPPCLPPVSPPVGSTSEISKLETTLAALLSRPGARAVQIAAIYGALRSSGEHGSSLTKLKSVSVDMDSADFASHLNALLSSSPPLAFWAGDTHPVVVCSEFLSRWTVTVLAKKPAPAAAHSQPSPKSKGKGKAKAVENQDEETAMEDRLVFPSIWLDISGQLVPSLWDTATSWLKGVLLSHPGITCAQISELARPGLQLSLHEVMLLISALAEDGRLERRVVDSGGSEEEDTVVDWDKARWFLAEGSWYNA